MIYIYTLYISIYIYTLYIYIIYIYTFYIYIYTTVYNCIHTYITLHYITFHYIALHCIALRYITLHCITLHYIALHCIALHYITLHTYRARIRHLFHPQTARIRSVSRRRGGGNSAPAAFASSESLDLAEHHLDGPSMKGYLYVILDGP